MLHELENEQYLRELDALEKQEYESPPGLERYAARVELYRKFDE